MKVSGRRSFLLIALALILGGCGGELKLPKRVCAGKNNVAESLDLLRMANSAPFRANGRCHLRYNDQGKTHNENFLVRLFGNPPAEIYLQGDVAFNPKGIILGSNEDQFWLAIKPKQISTYWWGRWDEQDGFYKLVLSPKTLLEAFGVVEIGEEENWSLTNKGIFDILAKRDEQGGVIKKIYVYSCDYRVRKMEYFDAAGEAVVIVELGKYKEVGGGFFVPQIIKITTAGEDNKRDTVKITLRSIKPISFTEKKRSLIFTPPKKRGYKNIYRIIGDDVIEQQQ
ncbi:MAG: hypothetical protein ACYS1A_02140 [Planctomycetota bacterium]